MILLRTVNGVRKHFWMRLPEWICAGVLIGWGFIVSQPNVATTTLRSFSDMFEWIHPSAWGLAAMVVGGVRLCALIINGSFADTPLIKWAPYGRMITAYLSMFFWAQMLLSVVKVSDLTTGIAAYGGYLAFDAFAVFQTAGDTRAVKVFGNARTRRP